jgi:hypothetical protein
LLRDVTAVHSATLSHVKLLCLSDGCFTKSWRISTSFQDDKCNVTENRLRTIGVMNAALNSTEFLELVWDLQDLIIKYIHSLYTDHNHGLQCSKRDKCRELAVIVSELSNRFLEFCSTRTLIIAL